MSVLLHVGADTFVTPEGAFWTLEIQSTGPANFGIHRVPADVRASNRCDSCGRADWNEVTARSFDEAVEFGWLVKVEEGS